MFFGNGNIIFLYFSIGKIFPRSQTHKRFLVTCAFNNQFGSGTADGDRLFIYFGAALGCEII
jgi:hypothetical protein